MKTIKVNSLGFELNHSVPDSIQEFDTLAGKVGAALEFAVDQEVAHGSLGKFRQAFSKGLEEETKVERPWHSVPAKKEGGKATEVWGTPEGKIRTEGEYFDYVLAKTNTKPEAYKPLAEKVMATIVFDPKESPSKGPGVGLAKIYLTAADGIIQAGKGAKVLAKLSETLGQPAPGKLEGDALRIALANAIKANEAKTDLAGKYAKMA